MRLSAAAGAAANRSSSAAISQRMSAHRRDHERILIIGVDEAVGPALRHDLVPGPETQAFLTVLADVPEAGTLPPAEAVIGHGHGDRHVDPDHPDIHPRGEFARRVAVAGEDRDAVAVLVLRRKADGFLEVLR